MDKENRFIRDCKFLSIGLIVGIFATILLLNYTSLIDFLFIKIGLVKIN